jgi:C-terminal processing protease CtpA/Prc
MQLQVSKNSKLLGTRYFENFKLTLNWREKKAYLLPVKTLDERKSWGITPHVENDTLYVGTLVYGSGADRAGIKQGDRITSINNIDFTTVTHEDYCSVLDIFLDDEIETLEIKVEGKGTVILSLERLF